MSNIAANAITTACAHGLFPILLTLGKGKSKREQFDQRLRKIMYGEENYWVSFCWCVRVRRSVGGKFWV